MARVGIDLDGVCYDFAASLAAYLLTLPTYAGPGEEFPPATCWEFYSTDWGLTNRQFIEYCHAGVDAGVIFTHGDPIEDAPNQLRRLREAGHTVHIITDRSFGRGDGQASRHATEQWLFKHGIEFDSLTFTADKTSVQTDYMIDDKVENYDALIEAGCDGWLLNRPWNRRVDMSRARVGSLTEFVDTVLAVEEDKCWTTGNPVMASTISTCEVRTTSSTGGQKGVKPQRFDLIPGHPLTLLAEHYGVGAHKYDDHQWRKGYEWSKSYAALMRHLTAWWDGEDIDAETGSSHVTCVAWHSFTLQQFIKDHPDFDDRPNSA